LPRVFGVAGKAVTRSTGQDRWCDTPDARYTPAPGVLFGYPGPGLSRLSLK